MRLRLVSGFLADCIQQIHSLRASGVMSSQVACADARGARLPELRDFDSSEPAATGVNYGVPLLGGLVLFFLGTLGLMLRPRLPLRR